MYICIYVYNNIVSLSIYKQSKCTISNKVQRTN